MSHSVSDFRRVSQPNACGFPSICYVFHRRFYSEKVFTQQQQFFILDEIFNDVEMRNEKGTYALLPMKENPSKPLVTFFLKRTNFHPFMG